MNEILLIRVDDRELLRNKLPYLKQFPMPYMGESLPNIIAFCDVTGSHFAVKVRHGMPINPISLMAQFPKMNEHEFYSLIGASKQAIAVDVLDKRPAKIAPSLWSNYPTITNSIIKTECQDYHINKWAESLYQPFKEKPETLARKGMLSNLF